MEFIRVLEEIDSVSLEFDYPEKKLLVALLLRSINDIGSTNKRISNESIAWFKSIETYPFSFLWTFEHLLPDYDEMNMPTVVKNLLALGFSISSSNHCLRMDQALSLFRKQYISPKRTDV